MSQVRFSQIQEPYGDLANKIRHIYDIHLMLKNANVGEFFNSKTFDKLLITVGKDDVISFKNNNKWLQNHPAVALIFSKTENSWDKIKNSYRTTFEELVIGNLPAEADLLDTLKQVHSRLEKVKWSIS